MLIGPLVRAAAAAAATNQPAERQRSLNGGRTIWRQSASVVLTTQGELFNCGRQFGARNLSEILGQDLQNKRSNTVCQC